MIHLSIRNDGCCGEVPNLETGHARQTVIIMFFIRVLLSSFSSFSLSLDRNEEQVERRPSQVYVGF